MGTDELSGDIRVKASTLGYGVVVVGIITGILAVIFGGG